MQVALVAERALPYDAIVTVVAALSVSASHQISVRAFVSADVDASRCSLSLTDAHSIISSADGSRRFAAMLAPTPLDYYMITM